MKCRRMILHIWSPVYLAPITSISHNYTSIIYIDNLVFLLSYP